MSFEAHFPSHSQSESESKSSHLGSKIECWLPTTQGSIHGVNCLAVLKAGMEPGLGVRGGQKYKPKK